MGNFLLQKKNIINQANQKLYEQINTWAEEASTALIELAQDYQIQARQIAQLGDGIANGTLKDDLLKKSLDERYDHLKGNVLDKSWAIRKQISVLLNKIGSIPNLDKRLHIPLKALRKEYTKLDTQLSDDFSRLLAIGDTPKYEQFEVFGKDIKKSQENLYEMAALIGDLRILVHNTLVANIYGKYEDVEGRGRSKKLTQRGIVDPEL